MRHSEPAPDVERGRIVRRSGTVFFLSIAATGIALFAGFGLAMSACGNAMSDAFSGLDFNTNSSEPVHPIAIPKSACPYLQLTATAAANAGAPWHAAFQPSADWKGFTAQLSEPLASFDRALTAAIPQVPAPVAQDLRTVRADVEIGQVQLLSATSVSQYLTTSKVLDGYAALAHASGLVGDACGTTLAPPIPF